VPEVRVFCQYSSSRLSEVQEPHPQPPPRKRGGDYDIPCMIRKRYNYELRISEFGMVVNCKF
jgi:hypothetical protein